MIKTYWIIDGNKILLVLSHLKWKKIKSPVLNKMWNSLDLTVSTLCKVLLKSEIIISDEFAN